MPHNWEIGDTAEVLCNSDCVVKVDDNMPPATRNKYCLSRTLKYLNLPHQTQIGNQSRCITVHSAHLTQLCKNKHKVFLQHHHSQQYIFIIIIIIIITISITAIQQYCLANLVKISQLGVWLNTGYYAILLGLAIFVFFASRPHHTMEAP